MSFMATFKTVNNSQIPKNPVPKHNNIVNNNIDPMTIDDVCDEKSSMNEPNWM